MPSLSIHTARCRCIALGFVALLLISGCAYRMPALTDSPTGVQLPGKVVWHDLITDAPDASKRFYSKLFGWEFVETGTIGGIFNSIDYTLIRFNGRLIGGMVNQAQLDTPRDISQWVSLISVADIDTALASVTAGGGQIVAGPVEVPPRGRTAIIVDPEGALISLVQTDEGDPVDTPDIEAGAFLWNELWATDIEKAADFYVQVAGYTPFDESILDDTDLGETYKVLQSQDRPRIGILKMPVRDLDPTWVSYLRIENASALDSIVGRVESLGGTVLLDPQERDLGGRVALIAGPSGAGIALQTWPGENSQ